MRRQETSGEDNRHVVRVGGDEEGTRENYLADADDEDTHVHGGASTQETLSALEDVQGELSLSHEQNSLSAPFSYIIWPPHTMTMDSVIACDGLQRHQKKFISFCSAMVFFSASCVRRALWQLSCVRFDVPCHCRARRRFSHTRYGIHSESAVSIKCYMLKKRKESSLNDAQLPSGQLR